METNSLFPVFLKLESLRTLLVGGGNVGLEKVTALLSNSPQATIRLVAGSIRDEIKLLALQNQNLTLLERDFVGSDLEEVDIVFLATDSPALHTEIRLLAHSKKLLVNVADTPALCDFYLGTVVTKGNLKIGISTNGKSPTMAKRIKEYLHEALPETTNELLENMSAIRIKLKGTFQEKITTLNQLTTSWLKQHKEK